MSFHLQKRVKRLLRWTLLSVLCGLLAGTSSAVFLILLDGVTQWRLLHPSVIWGLPLAGFFIGWIYLRFGKDIAGGNNLILEEIHDPKKTVPFSMAPLILLGTVVTHLFGGSAGREGTAVQMGASLADQLTHFFKIEQEERKILLVAGAGAGFASAIGAPLAGVVFGMEVIHIGRLRFFAWFECLIACFVAYFTTRLLQAPHSIYPSIEIPLVTPTTLFIVLGSGIIFGLFARFFVILTHGMESLIRKGIPYPPLKPALTGVLIVALYAWEGTYRYAGLGISFIQEALHTPASFYDPLWKAFFSALTVSSGFKGGEFIPLVFIGTTLGSALGLILPISFKLLAALGFAAVFAGAANTPLACSIMAMEIFGFELAPYALIACYASYYVSGYQGIYRAQKIYRKKHETALSLLVFLVELPLRCWRGKRSK